jgi:hypothetical protein
MQNSTRAGLGPGDASCRRKDKKVVQSQMCKDIHTSTARKGKKCESNLSTQEEGNT